MPVGRQLPEPGPASRLWPSGGAHQWPSGETSPPQTHPRGHLVYVRVCHALVLLADGHDATRVAHACGWSNPSSFITAFAGILGTTPGRYRAGSPFPHHDAS